VAGLVASAAVVTAALGWFGWRVLDQERDLERQRGRELQERAADAVAAGIRGQLAEAGERLSRGEMRAWPGAVVVRRRDGRVEVAPMGVLPFVPVAGEVGELDARLAAAEEREFGGRMEEAAGRYAELARVQELRAEALLRLGRVLRKMGDRAGEVYGQLAVMRGAVAGGVPADLAGLDGLERWGEIGEGVDGGRWVLSRRVAEFYRERGGVRPKPGAWELAEVLESAWGTEGVRLHGGRAVTMWRAVGAGAVGEIDALVRPLVPAGYGYAIGDGEGAPRVLGDAAHPWVVRVFRTGAAAGGTRPGLVAGMVGVVVVFLWGMVYLMARALRRESEAARLQSAFVANVSHEFRSPLTTVRQLAEMLEMGGVASEDRRQRYYGVLAGEARRLQRLVETLLDFGRMEAGTERYRFTRVEAAEVVARAAEQTAGGARVVAMGEPGLALEGDAEALTVALRNLIENALKYSPVEAPVEVKWGRREGRVFLAVADRGAGIAEAERGRIFERFVRGRAAAEGNVKGTGVGLAMVRHIAAAHGGEVRVESEVGRWSEFTLWLPEGR
jgi:signal transduction histidine kinase